MFLPEEHRFLPNEHMLRVIMMENKQTQPDNTGNTNRDKYFLCC
jgi:hypothetical protein